MWCVFVYAEMKLLFNGEDLSGILTEDVTRSLAWQAARIRFRPDAIHQLPYLEAENFQ